MYSKNAMVGYKILDITYDMDGQHKETEAIGMNKYVRSFTIWFEINTT